MNPEGGFDTSSPMLNRFVTRTFLIACALFAQIVLADAPGRWIRSTHWTLAGPLNYRLYLPESARGLPLIVALHGCNQTPERFAAVTRLNELAEQERFAVLYPEQPGYRNPDHCWNWFLPLNQVRGTGEPWMILSTVDAVVADADLDRTRIYLTGLSAGAAMANTLASCYADRFAGAALHSALEYLAASTPWDAQRVLSEGSRIAPADSARLAYRCSGFLRASPLPVILFQGSEDRRVNPRNFEQVFDQFRGLEDLLDDGGENGSFPERTIRRPGQALTGGYPYRTDDLVSIAGQTLVRRVAVDGLAHAWSGGAPGLPNSDPRGPDATRMLWEFLSAFRRSEARFPRQDTTSRPVPLPRR